MANRATPATQQETLSPPWLLSAFDTNWNSPVTALNDSSLGYVNGIPVDTGSTNAYAVTLPFGSPTAYQDGMCVAFIPLNSNNGPSTITVSPLGTAAILNPAGIALQGGEITVSRATMLVYKSASPVGFRIIGPCPLAINQQNLSTNPSYECAGYTSISALITYTGGTDHTAGFNHVAAGTPMCIAIGNNTGGAHFFNINVSTPAGVGYTNVFALLSGVSTGSVFVDIQASSFQINNGNAVVLNGASTANNQVFLSR